MVMVLLRRKHGHKKKTPASPPFCCPQVLMAISKTVPIYQIGYFLVSDISAKLGEIHTYILEATGAFHNTKLDDRMEL